MTKMLPISFLLVLILMASCTHGDHYEGVKDESIDTLTARQYYQIKTYTFRSSRQVEATDTYLRDAYLPGLKRLGFEDIGVFKLKTNPDDTLYKTFVLIPAKDVRQFFDVDERLAKDQDYLSAGSAYISAAFDQAPYERIESTVLRAFRDMPMMRQPDLEGPRSERIYELRSYESATEALYENKVEMFNEGGEIILFDRLVFNAVFYGEVISGSKMPNLMYMTTFSDMTSRDDHWKAFVDSPEWKELIGMSKYDNNLSKIDVMLLTPTEYSDY